MRAFFIGGSMDGKIRTLDDRARSFELPGLSESYFNHYSIGYDFDKTAVFVLDGYGVRRALSNTITVTPPATHFCRDCKNTPVPLSKNLSICDMGEQHDYVRGFEHHYCSKKNHDGLCKDFEARG
jgi:hypothetical protein